MIFFARRGFFIMATRSMIIGGDFAGLDGHDD
jgi:hypothetical protein